jgi:hypothetical protein
LRQDGARGVLAERYAAPEGERKKIVLLRGSRGFALTCVTGPYLSGNRAPLFTVRCGSATT